MINGLEVDIVAVKSKKKIKKSKPLLNDIIKTTAFKNIMAEQYVNKKERETYHWANMSCQ